MTATARIPLLAALTLAAFGLTIAAANAATVVALVDGKNLVTFDTETRAAGASVAVSGVDGLAGIDQRPGDKLLYGVSLAGELVTIDAATGAATVKATLSEKLPSYEGAIVDFNPMADRLRLMGADGTNHRVNPDDGAVTVDGSLAYKDGDMHAGETPAIVAAAYINSFGKPEATAMFDIDATIVALIQQAPPNDGTLAAIGKLGMDGGASYAFDIHATEDLTNTAYLVVDNVLYTVDLMSGAATEAGAIEGVDGAISDIAVWN